MTSIPLTGSVVRQEFLRRMLCHLEAACWLYYSCGDVVDTETNFFVVLVYSVVIHTHIHLLTHPLLTDSILNRIWSPANVTIRVTVDSPTLTA